MSAKQQHKTYLHKGAVSLTSIQLKHLHNRTDLVSNPVLTVNTIYEREQQSGQSSRGESQTGNEYEKPELCRKHIQR